MSSQKFQEKAIKKSISCPQDMWEAAASRVANDYGKNYSRYIQSLIECDLAKGADAALLLSEVNEDAFAELKRRANQLEWPLDKYLSQLVNHWHEENALPVNRLDDLAELEHRKKLKETKGAMTDSEFQRELKSPRVQAMIAELERRKFIEHQVEFPKVAEEGNAYGKKPKKRGKKGDS